MIDIIKSSSLLVVVLVIPVFSGAAAKDPLTRDEDISNTLIDVNVSKEGEIYQYDYTIMSSASNVGVISKFFLDLSCGLEFESIEIPVPTERPGYEGNVSRDGNHVPAELFAESGTSGLYAITVFNHALWGVHIPPGEQLGRLSVLSPAPPGPRSYRIEPLFRTDPSWDYSGLDEETPGVPWIDDFTVTGTVTGPACAKDDSQSDLFLGSGTEPFKINTLLSYSEPKQDPVYLDNIGDTFRLNIHYAESIQKPSFKAKLNGTDISDRFNPVPGKQETVEFDGPWKRLNRLSLSVLGVVDGRIKGQSGEKRPSQSRNTPADEKAARKFDEFKSRDTDVFHIWFREGEL